MRKWFAVMIGLMLWSGISTAQQNVPSLVVQGESKIFQMPDIMEVNVTISTLEKEYPQSITKNLEQLDQFKRELKSAGISSLVIKDVAQRVNEERSYSSGSYVTIGYRANYQMILQLNTNSDEIHKLLKVLRQSGVDINYQAAFKLSPELLQKSESTLLEKAVANAFSKAEVIARASKTELGSVLKMEYGTSSYSPGPIRYMGRMEAASTKSVGEEAFTQPDPIELSDQVKITWSIK